MGKTSKHLRLYLAALLPSLLLSGCFTSDRGQDVTVHPLINNPQFTYSMGTSSNKRLVFIHPAEKNLVCAEPPPQASQNVSISQALAVSAAVQNASGLTPEAKAGLSQELVSGLAHYSETTQGVKLFRAVSTHLCNLYAAGAVNQQQHMQILQDLIATTAALTQYELELTDGQIGGGGYAEEIAYARGAAEARAGDAQSKAGAAPAAPAPGAAPGAAPGTDAAKPAAKPPAATQPSAPAAKPATGPTPEQKGNSAADVRKKILENMFKVQ